MFNNERLSEYMVCKDMKNVMCMNSGFEFEVMFIVLWNKMYLFFV